MKVIKCADNTIRIKIEDTDSYEVTDDNGVNFWPTQKQVATIIRAHTDEQCRICSKATERKAREKVLDEPHIDQYINRIRKASKSINTGYPLKKIISVSLLIAAEHYERLRAEESLRAQQAGEP